MFRYRRVETLRNLTSARLNEYIGEHLGEEFTAKDFRTWGGTLLAAIAFAEHEPAETETESKRVVAGVMRAVRERLVNTPAVARAHTSARLSSSSTWMDERSRISARGICGSSGPAIIASITRNEHSWHCCVRGEFGARALPRELLSAFRYAPVSSFILFRRQFQWHERLFSCATAVAVK
ncbi:MAG: hypothetical protein ABI896_07595 [Actinomycetota bacterium]